MCISKEDHDAMIEALRPFANRLDLLEEACRRLDVGVPWETNILTDFLRDAKAAMLAAQSTPEMLTCEVCNATGLGTDTQSACCKCDGMGEYLATMPQAAVVEGLREARDMLLHFRREAPLAVQPKAGVMEKLLAKIDAALTQPKPL